ncbi:ankyrin repeat domain-containing protein [Paenibacillus sp. NPDC057886]|uniref:ankyrin repeat domain-containing protein n=1 Tax=Paenibacillus sp. NPDC057886 TaxID=3346270 RepID=UPI0036CC756C
MKKLVSKIPTFMLGAIVGVVATAGSVAGAATYFKATQSSVKIVVDGSQAKLSESPMNINGKLFLPVRDTANAMGYSVESVTSTQVSLKESVTNSSSVTSPTNNTSTTPSNPTNTNTIASKKVKNLKETYSTEGKLDATKIRSALDNKTLDLNAVDQDTGNTLLHYTIEENNFEAFKALKRNALNVNIQNSLGQTPLHIAILSNSSFYLGELKDLKADANIKDNDGNLPIDLAKKNSPNYISLEAYML